MKIETLIELVAQEYGVSSDAAFPFKTGYLIGMLEDLQYRFPEVKQYVDQRAATLTSAGAV